MYRHSTKTKIKQPKNNRRLHSKSLIIILTLGIIIIAVSLTKEIIRKIEIKREISSLESEIADLEQHNTELNNMMEYFNSSNFQEKEARTKLNLMEPGETVVVLPNQAENDNVNLTVATTSNSSNTPNYQKWFNYFFN